jgi:hypothetical protein
MARRLICNFNDLYIKITNIAEKISKNIFKRTATQCIMATLFLDCIMISMFLGCVLDAND